MKKYIMAAASALVLGAAALTSAQAAVSAQQPLKQPSIDQAKRASDNLFLAEQRDIDGQRREVTRFPVQARALDVETAILRELQLNRNLAVDKNYLMARYGISDAQQQAIILGWYAGFRARLRSSSGF